MRRAVATLAFVLGLAAPAAAGQVTIGSSLTAPATVFQSHPVDTVYWNTKLANGTRVKSPVKGEVATVRLKGRVNRTGSAAPNVAMFAQVLRPMRGGKVKVVTTSAPLKVPVGGSAGRIHSFDISAQPGAVCVRKGDYVALATNGGFGTGYEDGAQFQMFGAVMGSAFTSFTGAGKDMNDDVLRGHAHADRELLLQADVTSGRSAAAFCR